MGNKIAFNPAIFKDEHVGIAYGMGITAEKVAERWKVSREAQDEFAYQSHQRAVKAIASGEFNDEISPYRIAEHTPDLNSREIQTKTREVSQDEGPRADTSVEALAKLKPVFAQKGSVTAGNSSQMSDGAAAVLLCSEAALKRYNLTPIGKFIGFSVAGVPPEIMGIGPKEAIPRVLKKAGLSLAVAKPAQRSERERLTRFELLRREGMAMLVAGIILLLLSALIPAPIQAPIQDVGMMVGDTRAPWFFLWVQQLLKLGDPFIWGVLTPILVIVGLGLVPYVLPNAKDEDLGRWFPTGNRIAQALTVIVLIIIIVLTILESISA